ncbi:lamin tail domain-containing protein [Candidatus Falkowbacteria bacterium]|nr:lamin tail domain-containing protein [Candidatus Falkowbacteria bacterium]
MKKQKQKIKILILIIFTLSGFSAFPNYAKATDANIIINEIGAYETSENEWLEIFNKGTEAVDMTGWKFYEDLTNHKLNIFQNDFIIDAGEYAVIANVASNFQSQYPGFTGTILDSSWSSLKESGEEIGLRNSAGDLIESFTYIPCGNSSLQRINPDLADFTDLNWQPHQSSNSAGKINEFPSQDNGGGEEQNNEEGQENNGNDDADSENDTPPIAISKPVQIISSGTVVINEFVSDPADGDVEWIELYNKNVFDIDLSGWKIFDGAETATDLSGILGANFDNRFFIIENPKGKLNNSGDAIILKDEKNNIIDAVYFGNWDSGFISENAPMTKDPNSIARIFDGANTFKNNNDFVITQTPTKGETNIITLVEELKTNTATEEPQEITELKIDEKAIIISEIYPNPTGPDTNDEFVELKNTGTVAIDIANWKIKDNSKMTYKINSKDFLSTIINPNEFIVIERKISKIALNNDKDTIKLLNADDKTIQTVKYSEDENIPENVSYITDENNDWFWTTTPTKAQNNILTKLNHYPEIFINCPKTAFTNEKIICDASDSFDIDGDDLIFDWQINKLSLAGPIIEQVISQAGTYIISLTVSDNNLEIKETQKIKITEPKIEVDKITQPKTSAAKTSSAKTAASKTSSAKTINTAPSLEIEGDNQDRQVLKYLITSAAFLSLGLIAVIKKKKKAPNNNIV